MISKETQDELARLRARATETPSPTCGASDTESPAVSHPAVEVRVGEGRGRLVLGQVGEHPDPRENESLSLTDHFKVCDCHDSWDQCPCAEGNHPTDGSCNCCPRGTGLCGPLPTSPSGANR